MIDQDVDEIAEAMRERPVAWTQLYFDLVSLLLDVEEEDYLVLPTDDSVASMVKDPIMWAESYIKLYGILNEPMPMGFDESLVH